MFINWNIEWSFCPETAIPFQTALFDGSGDLAAPEECIVFIQYLHLVHQRYDMKQQKIHFHGCVDDVAYLRKTKAI